jgi:hypothetical protein
VLVEIRDVGRDRLAARAVATVRPRTREADAGSALRA